MEKIITGSGKALQKEVNGWLLKGWSIKEIQIAKQTMIDPKCITAEEESKFLKEIANGLPIILNTKGNSIQNSIMFYDYFLITLTKEKEK